MSLWIACEYFLARIRDFAEFPDSFDQGFNYTLGLSEQIIFPEIEYDRITRTQGDGYYFCN